MTRNCLFLITTSNAQPDKIQLRSDVILLYYNGCFDCRHRYNHVKHRVFFVLFYTIITKQIVNMCIQYLLNYDLIKYKTRGP